jgi:hypothetical protein
MIMVYARNRELAHDFWRSLELAKDSNKLLLKVNRKGLFFVFLLLKAFVKPLSI